MVCLLRSPLRWGGAGIVVAASFWAVLTPQPDLLISHDGRIVALRTEASRLSVMKTGTDVFAVRAWLSADADLRDPNDATLADGTKCDAAGCIGKLREGRLAALSFAAEAFEEDCRRAVVVVSPRDAPAACAALLIDRKRGRASGAMALYWNGENFAVSASRPAAYDRPWAKALAPAEPQTPPANIRRPLPDATPRPEDLEPGDQ
jgi:competence protein ComEC